MAHIFCRKERSDHEPLLVDVDDYEYSGTIDLNEPAVIASVLACSDDGPRALAPGDLVLAPDGLWMCCDVGWRIVDAFLQKEAAEALIKQFLEIIEKSRRTPVGTIG